MFHTFEISHQLPFLLRSDCILALWRDCNIKKWWGVSRLLSGEFLIAVYIFIFWFICPCVAVQPAQLYLILTHNDTVHLQKQMWRDIDVHQIKEKHSRLSTPPRSTCPLSGSVMVSNVSFSSAVSGEQNAGLSEGITESMTTPAASKQKFSNCRAGTTLPRIKRQYAPQLVHHWEIIVLLRSADVQVAKQIYDIITQTTDKRALYLGHTYMLSKGPLGGLQNNNKKKANLQLCPW